MNCISNAFCCFLAVVLLGSCATTYHVYNSTNFQNYDFDTLEDVSTTEFEQFTREQNRIVEEYFYDKTAQNKHQALLSMYQLRDLGQLPHFLSGQAYRLIEGQNGNKRVDVTSEEEFFEFGRDAAWQTVFTQEEVSHYFGEELVISAISAQEYDLSNLLVYATVAGSDHDFVFEWSLEKGLEAEVPFRKTEDGITDIEIISDDLLYYMGNQDGDSLTQRKYSKTLYKWERGKGSTALFRLPVGADWPMLWSYKRDNEVHIALHYFKDKKRYFYFSETDSVSQSSIHFKYHFEGDKVYSSKSLEGVEIPVAVTLDELQSNKPFNEIDIQYAEKPETDLTFRSLRVTSSRIYSYYYGDGAIHVYAHDKASLKLLNKAPIITSKHYGKMSIYTVPHYPDRLFIEKSNYQNPAGLSYLLDSDKLFEPVHILSAPDDFKGIDIQFTEFEATSGDGQKIPYGVAHLPGELYDDGMTWVKAYGGFNKRSRPYFTFKTLAFLKSGGKIIYPTLRGDGRKGVGKEWHTSGTLLSKKNTFMDLNAVITDVQEKGISTPAKTHLWGQSNGGLVVMSTIALHTPNIASAVVSVPIADMLNYTELGMGKAWVDEYGDPSNQEFRDYIASYSPVEDIYNGKQLPPILIFFSSTDDRVLPQHSIRLFKKLSSLSKSVFIYHNEKSGHNKTILKDEEYRNMVITMSFFRAFQ